MKNKLWMGIGAMVFSATASAGIPQLNYSCPGDLSVHADQGGPVYINGSEADLKKFSDSYFEAKKSGTTITIMINPDGSPDISYTAPHGVNGVCSASAGESAAGSSTGGGQ